MNSLPAGHQLYDYLALAVRRPLPAVDLEQRLVEVVTILRGQRLRGLVRDQHVAVALPSPG